MSKNKQFALIVSIVVFILAACSPAAEENITLILLLKICHQWSVQRVKLFPRWKPY